MRSHKEVTLTRKQIYDLVWSRPMRDVARELGFSDVGLKKLCQRNGIPTPPQGYHLMGTGAEKARLLKPLPDVLSRQQENFYFRVPDLVVEEARDAAKVRAQADMNQACRSLTSTERAEIRQVLTRVQSKLDRRKLDERGMIRSPAREFPIRVAPTSFTRAVSILTQIIEQAIAHGATSLVFADSDRQMLSFKFDGFRFTAQIEESSKRIDVPGDQTRRLGSYRFSRLIPTGLLTLNMWGSMYQTKTLRDGRTTIEQRMSEILEWILENVAAAKEEARIKEIRSTRAVAYLLEQDKERQKMEFEKRRGRQLEQEARKWRRAESLLGYLAAVESAGFRASQHVFESEDAWRTWLTWAHGYVAAFNPIALGEAGTTPPYPEPIQIKEIPRIFLDYDDPAEAMRALHERRW